MDVGPPPQSVTRNLELKPPFRDDCPVWVKCPSGTGVHIVQMWRPWNRQAGRGGHPRPIPSSQPALRGCLCPSWSGGHFAPTGHSAIGKALRLEFLAHLVKEATDLDSAKPPVPSEGPDSRDLPGSRPAGNGLGVDFKHCGDLARREELVLGH